MYVLYGGGVTRALGPQMVLEEANIPYELRDVDEFKFEHKTPEYLALNPAGFIPTLVTQNGTVLHEAAAIMVFLSEEHRLENLMPPPGHPKRGLFFCRLFYHTNDIQPPTRAFFKPEQYSTDIGHSAGIRDQARQTALDRWSVLNQYLMDDGPYHLGDRFSLLDLHMTLWAAYGLETPETIFNMFPAVKQCFDKTVARPKIGHLISTLQDSISRWQHEGKD